tara:strand:+ start:14521 stop:14787 length:267 start_codon:yes stop_codon:yes gene_type:complete
MTFNTYLNYDVKPFSWRSKAVRLDEGTTLRDLNRLLGVTTICEYNPLTDRARGWNRNPRFMLRSGFWYHVDLEDSSKLADLEPGIYLK